MTKLFTLHRDLCYLHLFNINYERDKAVITLRKNVITKPTNHIDKFRVTG